MMLVLLTAACCLSLIPVAAQTGQCDAYQCQNGGSCKRTCDCLPGYEGDWCEDYQDWHNFTCSDDNCSVVPNTTCFKDLCACEPGLYYSVNSRQCVQYCCYEHQLKSYSLYLDYGINYHNVQTLHNTTKEVCENTCNDDFFCRSFEFDTKSKKCNIHHITTQEAVNDGSWAADSGWRFYQRECGN